MKKPKPKKYKRAFHTYYYGDTARNNEATYRSQGHSATERGAIRGCVVRVFMGEHAMARVYDSEGVLIYTIKPGAHGMQIHYGRAS